MTSFSPNVFIVINISEAQILRAKFKKKSFKKYFFNEASNKKKKKKW